MTKRQKKKQERKNENRRFAEIMQIFAFVANIDNEDYLGISEEDYDSFIDSCKNREWYKVIDMIINYQWVYDYYEVFVNTRLYKRLCKNNNKWSYSALAGWWDHYYWTGRLCTAEYRQKVWYS